jgi:hypothetical protein
MSELSPMGHNNPPQPTPYEEAAAKVAEARNEALMWLDGAPVTSQDQADGLALLLDMARKASKAADEARKVEAKPFDDGKAEVQARYKPLLTDAERVADTLKRALGAWLTKVDADQRAKAEAARKIAEAAAGAAKAQHAAMNPDNLADREASDKALAEAARAAHIAKSAEAATAKAKSVTGARAVSLRTFWNADVYDPLAFGKWMWSNRNITYLAWLASEAAREIALCKHDLPGVKAVEERRAA